MEGEKVSHVTVSAACGKDGVGEGWSQATVSVAWGKDGLEEKV